jgi:hypothetical protein
MENLDADLDAAIVPRQIGGASFPSLADVRITKILRYQRAERDIAGFSQVLLHLTQAMRSAVSANAGRLDAVKAISSHVFEAERELEGIRRRKCLAPVEAAIRALVRFVEAGDIGAAELAALDVQVAKVGPEWEPLGHRGDAAEALVYLALMAGLEVRALEWASTGRAGQ